MDTFVLSSNGSWVLNADALKPILDAFFQNINVVMPIIIPIFGMLVCISIIPKLVNMFSGNKKSS